MSADLVAKYRDALKLREKSVGELREVALILVETVNGLQDPLGFKVSNSGINSPAIGTPTHVLDGHNWPSAKAIAEAVAAVQRYEYETVIAWEAIPRDERHGLSEPKATGSSRPWQ